MTETLLALACVLSSHCVPFASLQIVLPVLPMNSVAPMEGVFIYILSATETMTVWITLMNRIAVSCLVSLMFYICCF